MNASTNIHHPQEVRMASVYPEQEKQMIDLYADPQEKEQRMNTYSIPHGVGVPLVAAAESTTLAMQESSDGLGGGR